MRAATPAPRSCGLAWVLVLLLGSSVAAHASEEEQAPPEDPTRRIPDPPVLALTSTHDVWVMPGRVTTAYSMGVAYQQQGRRLGLELEVPLTAFSSQAVARAPTGSQVRWPYALLLASGGLETTRPLSTSVDGVLSVDLALGIGWVDERSTALEASDLVATRTSVTPGLAGRVSGSASVRISFVDLGARASLRQVGGSVTSAGFGVVASARFGLRSRRRQARKAARGQREQRSGTPEP